MGTSERAVLLSINCSTAYSVARTRVHEIIYNFDVYSDRWKIGVHNSIAFLTGATYNLITI